MISLNKVQTAVALMGLLCLSGVMGCSSGPLDIASPEAALTADEDSAAYLDRLSAQETVSQNDALRGILLLLDGEDKAATFAQRVETLRRRRIVPGNWNFHPDKPITRGKVAYMIYQGCKMSGGAILTLCGPSQRYCLRELQYQGFITQEMSWYGEVTGMEFVGVVTRADAFLETGAIPNVIYAAERR
jgi:hypothetical protein